MAEALAAAQIFQLTTLNDELIGTLDWVTDGRQLDDPQRLSGPETGATLSAKDARARVARSGEQAVGLLRRIPDSAWSTTGKWRGQDITLAELLQRHLIDHLREHLEQATAALDAG
jgi:hypothetical protein